jgi:cysteinyl-tRNA synthetase
MGDIIKMTESLIDQGYAYEVEGDVFFDVGRDANYGKLTNRTVEGLQGEGGGAAAKKRSAADFALWKSAKPEEPSWESPWGPGRPGWHIECSAMSRGLLGETFDIHGGGIDLIFPHHENEIAQSECCHGKPMAKIWMHNGLLRAAATTGKIGGRNDREDSSSEGGEKISRSKGAGGLADLIARQGGERIRFFLLRTHYRSTVLFSEAAIEEAAAGLETFYRLFKRYERIMSTSFYDVQAANLREKGALEASESMAEVVEIRKQFLSSMDDDFNTGGAVGSLFEMVRLLNKCIDDGQLESPSDRDEKSLAVFEQGISTLRELCLTLGLFISPPASSGESEISEFLDGVMQLVIQLRSAARGKKDFVTADRIRDGLGQLKISVEDRADETDWNLDDQGDNPETALDGLMQLLIELRKAARVQKDFATADAIRDALAALQITLEDRAEGTDWTVTSQ